MGFVRCEKCGGVCRGGDKCPEYGNPNAGEVVLTERERLDCPECGEGAPGFTVTPDRHGEPELEQCRACFDRTHPKEARDV